MTCTDPLDNLTKPLALPCGCALCNRSRTPSQAALDALPQSSYRRRLPPERAAEYDAKALKRARSSVGTMKRIANTRAWCFSVVARSLSWFNQRVPHRVWADACEDHYVASRPRCLALLHEMRRVEPKPEWTASPDVFVFAADQTYCWQGCKKRGRARQGAERTGPSTQANPVDIAAAAEFSVRI